MVPRGGYGIIPTANGFKRQSLESPGYAGLQLCRVMAVDGRILQQRGSLYAIFTPGGCDGFIP